MVSIETSMKLLFPTVAPFSVDNKSFVGIFKRGQNEQSVFVKFSVPDYPNATSVTYQSDLKFTEKGLKILESQTTDINFLDYLKLFDQAITLIPKQRTFKQDLFTIFYDEYCELKSQYADEKFIFNADNETFSIVNTDSCMVENTIVVQLNFYDDQSSLYNVIKHSFPEIKNKKMFPKQYHLKVIHQQFLKYVENLSMFHETLQRIDMFCWVTAPPNSTYEHNYRTIVIADNSVSIKMTFDPWNMSKLPEFKFLGPSAVLESYRSTLSENLANWDPDYDVLHNVMQLLDLPCFPIKPAEEDDQADKEIVLYDRETECSVCFSYHWKDEAPDVICDYESCRRQFHTDCLYEWLSRLPNCQIMFGTISGECPNCEKIVSCKVPAH